jgi:hypothetical protein
VAEAPVIAGVDVVMDAEELVDGGIQGGLLGHLSVYGRDRRLTELDTAAR